MGEVERKWRGAALITVGLVLATVSTVIACFAAETSSAYTTRTTGIYINDDSLFTPENGVTDGTGTESDPYIIEGWYIYVTPIGSCIEIINTRAHFTIRNCSLQGDSASVGPDIIRFTNVQNATVENVVGYDMLRGKGVGAFGSANLNITENWFHGNGNGVYLSGCSDVRITNNTLTGNWYSGMSAFSSSDVEVRGNEINENLDPTGYNGEGVVISDCRGIELAENNVTGNSGIGLWEDYSSDVTITGNQLAANGEYRLQYPPTMNSTGIYLHKATHTNLTGNSLIGEGVYLYYTSAEEYNTIMLDTSNTVNGNPVRFYRDASGVRCEGIPTGQLIAINCTDVKVSDIDIGPASVGAIVHNATGVEIADCRISGNKFSGIEVQDTSNFTLTGCNLSDNRFALYATTFSNLTVSGCRILGYSDLRLVGGDNASISQNTLGYQDIQSNCGFYLSAVNDITVLDNSIGGYVFGVLGNSCDGIVMEDNDIVNNTNGVELSECSNISIANNNVTLNGVGIRLTYCSGCRVYHNDFLSSSDTHAVIYMNEDSLLNEPYPTGGNYWDDYTGTDERAGEFQDSPSADGFGDTPYITTSGVEDSYPLMRPVNTPNAAPVAFFTVEPETGDVSTLFHLDASGSWDREDTADGMDVRWDFEGDDTWDVDWSSIKTADHKFSAAGTYNVTIEVRDSSGLTNQSVVAIDVEPGPEDTAAPITSAVPSGTMIMDGWYVSSVSMALVAEDQNEVSWTRYSVDDGDWMTYALPFEISLDGIHILQFHSSDSYGNEEPVRTVEVRIDTTAPILEVTPTENAVYDSPDVNISWACSDDCSGVASVEYSLDDGSLLICQTDGFVELTGLSEGMHRLTIVAHDEAGNNFTVEVEFQVDTNEFLGVQPYWLAVGGVTAVAAALAAAAIFIRKRPGKGPKG